MANERQVGGLLRPQERASSKRELLEQVLSQLRLAERVVDRADYTVVDYDWSRNTDIGGYREPNIYASDLGATQDCKVAIRKAESIVEYLLEKEM